MSCGLVLIVPKQWWNPRDRRLAMFHEYSTLIIIRKITGNFRGWLETKISTTTSNILRLIRDKEKLLFFTCFQIYELIAVIWIFIVEIMVEFTPGWIDLLDSRICLKMEEILEEISRDATSARLKHLKEACVTANGMNKFRLLVETWIYLFLICACFRFRPWLPKPMFLKCFW